MVMKSLAIIAYLLMILNMQLYYGIAVFPMHNSSYSHSFNNSLTSPNVPKEETTIQSIVIAGLSNDINDNSAKMILRNHTNGDRIGENQILVQQMTSLNSDENNLTNSIPQIGNAFIHGNAFITQENSSSKLKLNIENSTQTPFTIDYTKDDYENDEESPIYVKIPNYVNSGNNHIPQTFIGNETDIGDDDYGDSLLPLKDNNNIPMIDNVLTKKVSTDDIPFTPITKQETETPIDESHDYESTKYTIITGSSIQLQHNESDNIDNIDILENTIEKPIIEWEFLEKSETKTDCDVTIETNASSRFEHVYLNWTVKGNVSKNFKICFYYTKDKSCNTSNVPSECKTHTSTNASGSMEIINPYICDNTINYSLMGWYGCSDSSNYTHCTMEIKVIGKVESDCNRSNTGLVIALCVTIPLTVIALCSSAYLYFKKKVPRFTVKKLKRIPLSESSSSRCKRLDTMPTNANSTTTVINMEPHRAIEKSRSIKVYEFQNNYLSKRADSCLKLAEEYEELRNLCAKKKSARISQLPENKSKNRFVNILPYDHSIVKLKIENEENGSDYINANFVAGFNSNEEYIACQGPLKNTIKDFWRMVMEHDVKVIVMLTNCVEKGRIKCERYWPCDDVESDDEMESSSSNIPKMVFDDFTVELHKEEDYNDYIIRDIKVITPTHVHSVLQFHYTQWPDFGCPQDPLALINLIKVIRQHLNTHHRESSTISDENKGTTNSPTLVHCSAGVGRSGTFIAVDRIWQQLLNKPQSIDILGTVYDMRQYRPNMVQTEDQYIYIYECINQLIDQIKNGADTVESIVEVNPNIIEVNPNIVEVNPNIETQTELITIEDINSAINDEESLSFGTSSTGNSLEKTDEIIEEKHLEHHIEKRNDLEHNSDDTIENLKLDQSKSSNEEIPDEEEYPSIEITAI